jgi:hypothetical protein
MSPLYLYGLHGTSLEAAERILAHGWDVRAAAALATPRLRTGPRWVYAYWGEDLQVLMASRLWAAQQWAVEAVERHGMRRPYAGAVLLLAAPAGAVREDLGPEPLVHARAIRPVSILMRGVERPHAHAWAERPLFCEMCAREPELAWEEA